MANSSPPDGVDGRGRELTYFDEGLLAARDYWRAALARTLAPCGLAPDRPGARAGARRSASHHLTIDGDAFRRIATLTAGKPGLVHMLVTASVAVVLRRLTGASAVSIGSPPRGDGARPNALGLVIDVPAGTTFRALLAEVRRVVNEAYTHQRYPYASVLADFGIVASDARGALFDVSIACQGVHGPMARTHEDVALLVSPGSDRVALEFSYKPSLFDASTIAAFAERVRAVLDAATAEPGVVVDRLEILLPGEREQVLGEWTRAPADDARDVGAAESLHLAFERRAVETPDAIAVECNGARLTYGELQARSSALAATLIRAGAGPEDIVGIHLPPSTARVVAVLGVLKAGSAFLPLDPDYPEARLRDIAEQAHPRMVIVPGWMPANVSFSMPALRLGAGGGHDAAAEAPPAPAQPAASSLAYVIYTSGSTGRPKGVACLHGGLANLAAAQARAFRVERTSRVLQFASFGFDASVSEMAMALVSGATLVLAPREHTFPGDVLHAFLTRERITHVTLVPSVLELLPDAPLPDLVTLAAAGEACPAHLVERWAPGRLFLNAYGPTEVTVCATMGACAPGEQRPSIGRAIAHMEVFVLDEAMQPVPPGVEGELYVGGAGLARGYVGEAASTAARFVPHPFSTTPGARLYRTGDRVRFLADGRLDFIGRADTQVKIRGSRIELDEIDATLRRHDRVRDAAVVCREDAPGVRRLVAYVEARGEAPSEAALREHLLASLPDYMVPEVFIALEALPRTPKDTVDRKALPPPGAVPAGRSADVLQPRDAVELDLQQIWERVLDRRPIGVRDNFFAIGGHSFLAVKLLSEIRAHFDSDLPLPVVLQKPTIEELAGAIRDRGEEPPWSPIVTLRSGAARPLFCVHPAGGTVLCYADLAAALGETQPFHALQAIGLAEGQVPLRTVPAMASMYVDAIRAAQAHGPYLLSGWSAGGLIAFEMAQQLLAAGERVALLAMVDSYPPAALDLASVPAQDDVTLLLALFGDQLQLSEQELRALDPEPRLARVLDLAKGRDIIPQSYRTSDARRLLDVFAAISEACGTYRPQPYEGRVTLFSAREQTADAVMDPDDAAHGWQKLARGGVKTFPVHSSHLAMMRPPVVNEVADRLRDEIAQAG